MRFSPDYTLGLLGGGQLGRMLIQRCISFGLRTAVLDPDSQAPCRYYSDRFTVGAFGDCETVLRFGRELPLVTIEIEHVSTTGLYALEAAGVPVYPQPAVLELIQDKGTQKLFYQKHHLPTAPFCLMENREELEKNSHFLPAFQKLRRSGYDGKGVTCLRSVADIPNGFDAPSVLEQAVDIQTELSVIVSRNPNGQIAVYPPVELVFHPEKHLVSYLFSPSRVDPKLLKEATDLAVSVAQKLSIVGLLAVELFLDTNNRLLINEIAPRPHNSGHHTIEANHTDQFESHLRAILNLPPGDTTLRQPAVMVNLLGADGQHGKARYDGLEAALAIPGVHLHLYGKAQTRPYRKMGHLTVTANDLTDALAKAKHLQQSVRVLAE